jgi:hypothetical protein
LAWLLALAAPVALMVTVAVSVEPNPAAARLDCYTDTDGSNYFALTLKPPANLPAAAAHDIVVFLETSASQTGEFRDKALASLEKLLAGLGPEDRVQLMSVNVERGFIDFKKVGTVRQGENREKQSRFVD